MKYADLPDWFPHGARLYAMMMRASLTLVGLGMVACGSAPDAKSATDSAAGVTERRSAETVATRVTTTFDSLGDRNGRIPVLEYHVIGDSSTNMFVITKDLFRKNLQTLYDRGYRPITVAQLLDKDFAMVPTGMSPVVFTFDDASPEQFSYIERNGTLEIDPESAIGIWMDFAKQHPDWKGRATFCLLPAAEAGHAFFGDKERFRGQKKEWRFPKVKWLADNGFELCNHTLWHAQLSKYPDAFVAEQIARGQLAIDSVVPGYKVRTFALPQGLWPKNRALAWRGSWTDAKSGKTTTYNYDTVLEVSGGPNRSPYDPEFDRTRLSRVIVFGSALENTLDRLDARKIRFVWDGGATTKN